MIGQTVSHYKILEKLGEGGMSPACQVSPTLAGRENHPRIPLSGMSGCDFQDPPLSGGGGS